MTLSRSIIQDSDYKPDQPYKSINRALFPNDPANGVIAYNESIRAFMQEIAELQLNRAAFCKFIVAHLSAFSMDQCHEKAGFKFLLIQNDPLLLFHAFSQVHLMGGDAPNAAAQLLELLAPFFKIKMNMRDDLYTCHMDFSTLRAQIEEVKYAKLTVNALTAASSVNPPISVDPVPKALAAIDEELAISTFVKGLVDPPNRIITLVDLCRISDRLFPLLSRSITLLHGPRLAKSVLQ